MMAGEDDLEAELDVQLASQREALAGIDEAINSMGGEDADVEGIEELVQMRVELSAAVAELEAALLEIKRARITQQYTAAAAATPDGAGAEGAGTGGGAGGGAGGGLPVPTGGACRFRYMDGRWYAGRVRGRGRQAGTVAVTFEVATRPFMLDPVEVMEALVQPYGTAVHPNGPPPAATPQGGPVQQQQRHQGLCVGRSALALLPGSRLYVPVEVVALDYSRATATVLPLLQPSWGGRGGGGGGGGEMVVPLVRVTRHAHAEEGGAVVGTGGDAREAEEGAESDGDGGSSSSISALLRPATGGGSGSDGEGDEYGDDDGEYGQEDEEYEEYNEDMGGGYVDDDYDDDYGEDGRRGELDVFGHARTAAAAGPLDDTARLAGWEAHGRGVASRLMARMGYRAGAGLGLRGEGVMAAPEVLMLPERRGLGAVDMNRVRRVGGGRPAGGGGGGSGSAGGLLGVRKKRSKRGGAKEQRKRAIVAARDARAEAREEAEGVRGGGGLFDFINSSLGDSSAAARIRKAQTSVAGVGAGGAGTATGGGGRATATAGAAAIASAAAAAGGGGGGHGRGPPDRRGLMSHHDHVAGIQTKLSRLHDMLSRHRDNKGMRAQIEAQLAAVQAELQAAQSAAARAGKAIQDKDAQKKWMKF